MKGVDDDDDYDDGRDDYFDDDRDHDAMLMVMRQSWCFR